jgi:hypothetical protein
MFQQKPWSGCAIKPAAFKLPSLSMPGNRSYFSLLLRVLTLVCVALLISYSAPNTNKRPARGGVGLGLGAPAPKRNRYFSFKEAGVIG